MANILKTRFLGMFLFALLLLHIPLAPISAQNEEFHTHFVNDVEYNANGTLLATASRDTTIRVWDTAGNQKFLLKGIFGHNDSVLDISWSPDGNHIISGGVDELVLVWNMTEEEFPPRNFFDDHFDYVKSVAWNPNSTLNLAASGSNDGTIYLFNPLSPFGKESNRVLELSAIHDGRINDLKWSDDGKIFASVAEDGRLQVYTLEGDGILIALTQVSEPINDLTMNGDATKFVIITKSTVQTFSRISGTSTLLSGDTNLTLNCGNSCLNLETAISPSGDKVAITNSTTVLVYGWSDNEIETTNLIFSIDVAKVYGLDEDYFVTDLDWNPNDNNELAFVAGADIFVYDTVANQEVLRIAGTIPEKANIVLIAAIVIVFLIIAIILIRRQRSKGKL